MNPRDAMYSTEGMIDPHTYDLDGARTIALETVQHCNPETLQDLLDEMRRHGYGRDDLNRRAVLSLLVEARIEIDRLERTVRLVRP